MASKRILKDLKDLQKDPPTSCSAGSPHGIQTYPEGTEGFAKGSSNLLQCRDNSPSPSRPLPWSLVVPLVVSQLLPHPLKPGRRSGSMRLASLSMAARLLHAASQSVPRLSKFSLNPPKAVEVKFSDGSSFSLSAEFLRVCSPAADSKIRSFGGEKVIFGRRHVGIMSAEQVGNYGVKILFDDLHKTGIYTWDYFYHLGTNKFTLMRDYIKTLKKHGLSRDPQRRK